MITLLQKETAHEDSPWRAFSYGNYVFVTGSGYDEPWGSITVFKLVNGLLSFLFVHPLTEVNDIWFDGTYLACTHAEGFDVYTFTEEALTLVDSYEFVYPGKIKKVGNVWHVTCYDLGLCAFTLVADEIVLIDNEPVLEADFEYLGIDGYEVDASNHIMVVSNGITGGDNRKVLAFSFNTSTGYTLITTCEPTGYHSTISIALVKNEATGIHQLWGSISGFGVDVYEYDTNTDTITYKATKDNGESYSVYAAGSNCFESNRQGLFINNFDGDVITVVDSYVSEIYVYDMWTDGKKVFVCCSDNVLNFTINEVTSTKEKFTLSMNMGF